jgi:hypothetical protein
MGRCPYRTRFTDFFIRENHLEASFRNWLFYPGMTYRAREKWWEPDSFRTASHEGLDFCLYEDREGRSIRLDGHTVIPAMYGGVIIKIFDDFIGKSIVVEPGGDRPLLGVYGHTRPVQGLSAGRMVGEGEVIALLAPLRQRKMPLLHPHLHISLLWSGAVSPDRLDWSRISAFDPEMIDPLDVLDGPYRVVSSVLSDPRP